MDKLDMGKINSLPQPFIARFLGGNEWPVIDFEVETALLRIDVCGKLQVMSMGEVVSVLDGDGVRHDVDTFFLEV